MPKKDAVVYNKKYTMGIRIFPRFHIENKNVKFYLFYLEFRNELNQFFMRVHGS